MIEGGFSKDITKPSEIEIIEPLMRLVAHILKGENRTTKACKLHLTILSSSHHIDMSRAEVIVLTTPKNDIPDTLLSKLTGHSNNRSFDIQYVSNNWQSVIFLLTTVSSKLCARFSGLLFIKKRNLLSSQSSIPGSFTTSRLSQLVFTDELGINALAENYELKKFVIHFMKKTDR